MIKSLTLKPKSFGLDFSDLSLKIVNLEKRGRFFKLTSWLEINIEPGVIEQGEVQNRELLSKIIKESLNEIKGQRLKTKNVVASLPEKRAFLEVIKMPKIEEEELKTAVPFEAENYIPFSIDEVYLDFEVIPSIKGHSDEFLYVLIAAIPRSIAEPYAFCLKKAGLKPQALEIESQAIVRALVKRNFNSSPLLIVDFGKSRTSFIIFSGYSPRFTSSIPISSYQLDQAIARSLKIDLEKAEQLKIKYGLEPFYKKTPQKRKAYQAGQDDISKAINPILLNLVKEIKKYLDYYQNHIEESFEYSKKIEKIILCGRGANLKGLPDFLSSRLKIPVKLGNPWINILPSPLRQVPDLSFSESLGYTSALGLALRGAREE